MNYSVTINGVSCVAVTCDAWDYKDRQFEKLLRLETVEGKILWEHK